MKRRDVLTAMAAAVGLLIAAGSAVSGTRQPFERPDFLVPKNLSACELRHLSGPWTAEKLTAAEREAELKKLHTALDEVRQACAAGRDEYLP